MVTVALPTYQRATQLQRAIESVLAQDYEPVELIISDNGSTDGTRELCEDYVTRYPSIRYLRQPVNIGPTSNYEGLRPLARGDYFVFLGDDDWLDSRYVSACVASIESNPGSSLVAGQTIYHRVDGVEPDMNPVNLSAANPRRRVLDFCWRVRANSVFYGVTPIADDRRASALRNVMGGDWLRVMAFAYLGSVRTLDDVALHRTAGLKSARLADVGASLGLGWFQTNAPQIAIAYWIFREIAIDSPLYAELGRSGRLRLGLRAGGIIFVRFVPRAMAKFAGLQAAAVARRLHLRTSWRF
ncbi:MAG: hypothetical protein QOD72_1815 [Acidimicrobiaceae bacterium]|jgi:glycosyltransferase involved in cell wall biosynthesis|nr:hypothetical protein [Acidimicrobiaceae bacterium]